MTVLMRLEWVAGGVVHGSTDEALGSYLKAYDPDAFDGRGSAEWTADAGQAMHFADAVEALTLWKSTSKVRPLREDGLPNRPLTAFTVSIVSTEDITP